ncbi:3'-5' exonuclease [Prevotella melaninogenica]|uniref:3'-5' exonuclease n=1 Tax=Prevotella melaninogenica TaxID=28132 RepID=UPI001C5DFF9B|nr:3'-5' exonuclease [Prevotella melaninogenica]MBW4733002.1 UvrD-helicase domain-containing protein [Prevotella melaninogenica]MBW4735507.1 UvrD-helicase domain-containing protein [Prevotella melaninogenica]MBW4878044.1 UvrD-helicase domain-containing protein [Prevotella melaninogenica]
MEANNYTPSLDKYQIPVVEASQGYHLVLASPGCGKTHILAERIRYARERGVKYEDMLCLTFTNRAAREMTNRIQKVVGGDFSELMVGNVHRFCSKFLFEQGRIPADSAIIDDEEAVSIIADYRNEDEEGVTRDFNRYKGYQTIIFFQHFIYQMEHQHPWKYYLHPESFTDDDREAVKHICASQKTEYDEQAVVNIYHHAQEYMDEANAPGLDGKTADRIRVLLWKMYYANCYARYKEENHLFDFEDLLLYTYDIYNSDPTCKRYPWIQVDEVQDLNGMQLAIIDLLTAEDNPMVMYLGDEQQAIFSFMGAKVETLTLLKMRCKGNIHHLQRNHRSPKYLLDVFNDYAEKQLKIDRELLPLSDNDTKATSGDLRIIHSSTIEAEHKDITTEVLSLYEQNKEERTAVIVSANSDADRISEAMTEAGLTHFKVSGRDLFDTPDVKLLLAHLSVLSNEHNSIAWTRIMKGVRAFPSHALARRFNWKLKQLALSPSDFLLYPESCYTAEFLRAYNEEEIVVFDTETTGLNVFQDDIIEIAAIRIKGGEVVGEPLDLYIETDKPILPMLGDKENPMYAIYHEKMSTGELLSPSDALRRFLAYVGTSPILGHNANYDYNIVDNNLQRYCNDTMQAHDIRCFDSLKLIRLLALSLHSYKLESLLETFQLAGVNSHQAIDDVKATVSLVRLCAEKAREKQAQQAAFIRHPKVKPFTNVLHSNYGERYREAVNRLYKLSTDHEPALVSELSAAYNAFHSDGLINDIPRLDYILRYLRIDMLTDETVANALAPQLSQYIMDINTLKEADFCNSKSILERIYVTTVHKAKGLEFDNVIIFDAADGRYPNAYNKTKQQDEEDARKFYVAMSRAKRRLFIAYALQMVDRHGRVFNRELTPLMDSIQKYFN